MQRIDFGGAVIINDCYNASPTSMAASLGVLAGAKGRRLALLGDMLELGERSDELHRGIGTLCAKLGIDGLFTVGGSGKLISDEARAAGLEKAYNLTPEEAAERIGELLAPGDTLLVKASRGMKLERIIKAITE